MQNEIEVGRVPLEPGSRASTEPVPVSAASGFDPSRRLSAGDKFRLINAGCDFGAPQFSRQACEHMRINGWAAPRKEDGRWRLTPKGRDLQRKLLGRDSDTRRMAETVQQGSERSSGSAGREASPERTSHAE